ncbi:hypothetical protein HHI36_014169 [Cryptolaemus montrouzieri]|uniref:Ribosomal protein eL8/eL30/eS12/Gadd45 domain-containing protein n=1 Tax=Cryptolaemus montrouzieri TaxID=559131 RepID=A0ABD2N2R4_9CUCU
MEIPVLSKLQKKLSLSGKKQKKEIIKNVVVSPYQKYWPVVEDENLVRVLRENLPRVRSKKINVPWNVLSNIPKEERRMVRKEYIKQNSPSEVIVREENLIFGVNEVTKLLECNSFAVVLIHKDCPKLLVDHIVDLAILHNVPLLVVSELKDILKEYCGLESLVIAIKTTDIKPNLSKIVKVVKEISENYPPPAQHINSKRIEQDNNNYQISEVDTQLKNTNFVEKTRESTKIQKCHLYRTTVNERTFIPENSKKNLIPKLMK